MRASAKQYCYFQLYNWPTMVWCCSGGGRKAQWSAVKELCVRRKLNSRAGCEVRLREVVLGTAEEEEEEEEEV